MPPPHPRQYPRGGDRTCVTRACARRRGTSYHLAASTHTQTCTGVSVSAHTCTRYIKYHRAAHTHRRRHTSARRRAARWHWRVRNINCNCGVQSERAWRASTVHYWIGYICYHYAVVVALSDAITLCFKQNNNFVYNPNILQM